MLKKYAILHEAPASALPPPPSSPPSLPPSTFTYQTCDLSYADSPYTFSFVIGGTTVSVAGMGRDETGTVTFNAAHAMTGIELATPDLALQQTTNSSL